jgi:hypothetical protein
MVYVSDTSDRISSDSDNMSSPASPSPSKVTAKGAQKTVKKPVIEMYVLLQYIFTTILNNRRSTKGAKRSPYDSDNSASDKPINLAKKYVFLTCL